MDAIVCAIDHPSEQEAARLPRHEHVAVHTSAELFGLKDIAPNLIARAVIADARRYCDGNLIAAEPRCDDNGSALWSNGTVGTEYRSNVEIGIVGALHQVLRIDAECVRNAVEPADRYSAGARFEPSDSLRSSRRVASLRYVIKGHSPRTANFADPSNHGHPNQTGFSLSYNFADVASIANRHGRRSGLANEAKLLREQVIELDGRVSGARRAVKSVTVNVTESPLGWLFARGYVSQRQFDAGERLRADWERAQLAPRVTMIWDSAPVSGGRCGSAAGSDPSSAQIDARRRFDQAIESAGPGLADILWRIVCSGEGMREAETALGWPARAGRLVLTFALDRIANFYRIK